MASYDPKFVEYFSPSVKISDVISSIKDLYFGKGPVNIYEKFLDEIKSVMDLDKKIRNRMPSYDQYYDPKFAEDFSPSVKISVVISSIKDLYFGKGPVNIDEKFLDEIKSVLESKIAPGNLPLPNEMLVKIFSYLDHKEISQCAQVSKQFKGISEETWKSWNKITIEGKEVPSEFLTFLLEKGIQELRIIGCKMLPPKSSQFEKVPVTIDENHPLQLKSLFIDEECTGYDGLITNVLINHPMERIELDSWHENKGIISSEKFREFIASLPQTGSQLKSLALVGFKLDRESLDYILSCVKLEELCIGANYVNTMALFDTLFDPSFLNYISDNLTPSILKLDLSDVKIFNDNALCKLVSRCSKLQTMDIRGSKVTWNGVSAIIDNLQCLEYLAVPSRIGEELGLGNKIDMLKMEKLRSMKQLKCLLIGNPNRYRTYNEILVKEMPHLIIPKEDCYFCAAMIDDSEHKEVEFLSPTNVNA